MVNIGPKPATDTALWISCLSTSGHNNQYFTHCSVGLQYGRDRAHFFTYLCPLFHLSDVYFIKGDL